MNEKELWTRIKSKIERGGAWLSWALALITAAGLFVLTEVCNYNTKLAQMSGKNILMNGAILFFVLLTVYVMTDRWWVSIGFCGILFTLLGIINIYSMLFRSTPISARDLFNARSAMNVLGSYDIAWNKRVGFAVCAGVGFCLLAFISFLAERKRKFTWKRWAVRLVCGAAAIGAFFWWGCLSPHAIKPANLSTLRYEEGYQVYGFMQVSVEIFQKAAYKVAKPAGYTWEQVAELEKRLAGQKRGQESDEGPDCLWKNGAKELNGQTPDIILIINESWYDLTLVADLTTDVEVMPYIHNMENTLQGYIVGPMISGGTNLSEYEALTGNSLQLMQGITPFNSLNMEGAMSMVSCLKEQGYETAVMHPETRSTYNRIIAYPAMGFDSYYFIDDFEEWDYWEQRTEYVTDASCFRNMLKVYDAMEDGPRFFYNLTTQNHGDYVHNNFQKSTVHVQEDLGEEWLGYRANEYLSCVNLTDQAFKELTEELAKRERPVLVCMLGDHGPAFLEDVAHRELAQEEMNMRLHSTPYVIWANYDLGETELPKFMGLPYVPSVLLKLSGAELTPYYQYMAEEMLPQVPVLTAYAQYGDKDGEFYVYGEESPYEELLNAYFYMEYNTLTGKGGQAEGLFHLEER